MHVRRSKHRGGANIGLNRLLNPGMGRAIASGQPRGRAMKRRQFLKSTAAIAGTAGFGFSEKSFSQAMPDVIHVGHLVGICMSPLFYAQATGLFAAEGLKVEMKFMPNPGDALTALTGGVQQIVHIPFTNIIVAANNGAPLPPMMRTGAPLFAATMNDLKQQR